MTESKFCSTYESQRYFDLTSRISRGKRASAFNEEINRLKDEIKALKKALNQHTASRDFCPHKL